jgi:hypothetical protein
MSVRKHFVSGYCSKMQLLQPFQQGVADGHMGW